MTKSSTVAIELRKLADALDTIPNAEIKSPILVWAHYGEREKALFLNVAKMLPKPIQKEYEDRERGDLNLRYKSDGLRIIASIPRSSVCRIIEPAKPAIYDCMPLLEQRELDEIFT